MTEEQTMDEQRLSEIEERRATTLNWFDEGGPVPLKDPLIVLVDQDIPALIAEVRRLQGLLGDSVGLMVHMADLIEES